ncbi:sensor histidine kinase [Rubrimonas cliftonensis]|uniref:histidine kinase n=1 Tax=Rubrimonas cliftonensis TaxID=89524 RepID=A0A1H3YVU7_9RHOB|nr:HAMP domain-containing sensor histidine kinase [Rubrimonas cliftonensis]SEA15693.1 Signal transduction histidine kinase [Rubrimonas cliftonensis]
MARSLTRSLSGRLLILAILAVMVVEVVIFLPSVARFREDYLLGRLRMAELASLALLATPEGMLDPELEAQLLRRADAASIVLRRGGARALALSDPMARMVQETYDLRDAQAPELIADAVMLLFSDGDRVIRVIGAPAAGMDVVEITMEEAPLLKAGRAYALRILQLSLIISMFVGVLLYLLTRRLLVRPMARIVASMAAFRENPEGPEPVFVPSSAVTEVAVAEEALAAMQTELRAALRQKARLASLGEAVARIAHDLRNLLSTAQLLADRLEGSADPVAARVGPKLVGSLDRAVALCQSTLRFGAAQEAPPAPRETPVARLAAEVADAVFPDAENGDTAPVRLEIDVAGKLCVWADPDQLHRVLVNLVRNARAAIEGAGRSGVVRLSARQAGAMVEIDVADEGPGLPRKALDNLFQPFRGGAGRAGTGLGLAIARDLAEMQGGALTLVASGEGGARFRVSAPARPPGD